jgi:hypothetical protein
MVLFQPNPHFTFWGDFGGQLSQCPLMGSRQGRAFGPSSLLYSTRSNDPFAALRTWFGRATQRRGYCFFRLFSFLSAIVVPETNAASGVPGVLTQSHKACFLAKISGGTERRSLKIEESCLAQRRQDRKG